METFVLGSQKNGLIETVLSSTHNINFGWGKKIVYTETYKVKIDKQNSCWSYIGSIGRENLFEHELLKSNTIGCTGLDE